MVNMKNGGEKKSKLNDYLYFKGDNFRLYHGDNIKLLALIPDNAVDLIFADPPYFLSNGSFTCQNGKMVSVKKGDWDMGSTHERNFDFHCEWLSACHRVLKPNGSLWLSGTYHSIFQCGFALQKCGYHVLNDIAWFKPNASPNLSCRYFTASHETLIWARKSKSSKHVFNYDLMKNGNWKEDFLKKPNKQMRSVWAMGTTPREEKTFGKHPTQKPTSLLKRIVLASSNKGDIVLDPFTGSSTTGIACKQLSRNFIGIDIEKQYLELSKKRYELFQQNGNSISLFPQSLRP